MLWSKNERDRKHNEITKTLSNCRNSDTKTKVKTVEILSFPYDINQERFKPEPTYTMSRQVSTA